MDTAVQWLASDAFMAATQAALMVATSPATPPPPSRGAPAGATHAAANQMLGWRATVEASRAAVPLGSGVAWSR
jgi:hypothetical protein